MNDRPLEPQPPPVPAAGDIWADLIPNLPPILQPYAAERRQQGIGRYGTPLQVDNGRDALLDLFQEQMDAIAYARQHNLKMRSAFDEHKRQHGYDRTAQWWMSRVVWSAERVNVATTEAAATAAEMLRLKAGPP